MHGYRLSLKLVPALAICSEQSAAGVAHLVCLPNLLELLLSPRVLVHVLRGVGGVRAWAVGRRWKREEPPRGGSHPAPPSWRAGAACGCMRGGGGGGAWSSPGPVHARAATPRPLPPRQPSLSTHHLTGWYLRALWRYACLMAFLSAPFSTPSRL